jgi:hypothetical protein
MGRPFGTKNIETPEKMWEYFLSYKDYVKKHPIIVKDWVGKDATDVHREKERPLTFIGFQNYLDDQDIISDVTDYFENKDNRYADFVRICSRIKRNIQDDQIAGGMVGIYNPSITQRLNGLTDNVDLTTKGKEIQSSPTTIQVEITRSNED